MPKNKVIFYILTTAGIVAGLFLFPFFLSLFAPFVAAFFVAAPCQKIIKYLQKKVNLNRGISSALISTLMVVFVISLLGILLLQLFSQSKNLIVSLPSAIDSFREQIRQIGQQIDGYKHSLPQEVSIFLDNLALNFKDYVQELSGHAATMALNFAGNIASRLPKILLFVTMFILATFFFTKDYPLVINFLKDLFPAKGFIFFSRIGHFLTKAFSSYIKAQLMLMLLTSFLVTICLWIIGKSYPLLWGIICGLVDALPIFGTAAVLVPWALISLIYGDTYSFIALLIIQVIVFLVRQLAEPKIVSHQIGIHPLLTLISVYIGLKFFGVPGVILAPIAMMLIVNIYVSYKEKADN